MARFSHPNILKLGKSQLVVKIRRTFDFDQYPPCPSTCYSSPLHITFCTHSEHRFLDPGRVSLSSSSNSHAFLADHRKFIDEKTICQDRSLFFKYQEKANSRAAVKKALRSLKVKKSLYGIIFKKVMAFWRRHSKVSMKAMTFGRRYNKVSNEKKVLKGMVVSIVIVKSYIGDRDSVHEVMEKSWEEEKSEARARGDGDIFLSSC